MYENENDNNLKHILSKLIQVICFTALFFFGSNVLLKYMSLIFKSIKYGANIPEDYFKFKWHYLIEMFGSKTIMAFGISFMLACFITMRIEVFWQVKHGSKNIKSDDRFMNNKEMRENFVCVENCDFTNAETGGVIMNIDANNTAYIDTENVHNLIIGTTRSGKGQTVAEPLIYSCMKAKNKQSMIINDMKGDICEDTYATAQANGYQIYILNLDNDRRSDEWDPLYYAKIEYAAAMKDADKFGEEPNLSKVTKKVTSIAKLLTDDPHTDPLWPESAKWLLVAMILFMFDEGYKSGKLDLVTMPSVQNFFINYASHDEMRGKIKVNALDQLFQQLPFDHPAKAAYSGSNFAKGEMRGSIFSILATNLSLFGTDYGVRRITSGNTIDFEKLIDPERPCVIYLILPDEDRSRDVLASMFIDQCYDYLAKRAKTFPRKYLPRRVRFVIDEFGTMPVIPAMDSKVSLAAGHNMLFDLVIQDLNFFDNKYGSMAKSIRGTIGNVIYINSIDKDTNSYISLLLGNKQYEYKTYSGDLREWLKHQNVTQETKPLLSATQLGRLKKERAIIIRQRCYPIYSNLRSFWKLQIKNTPIDSMDTHVINKKLKDVLYPIKDFEKMIGMKVIVDSDTPAPVYDLSGDDAAGGTPSEQLENSGEGLDFVDIGEMNETAAVRLRVIFDKLDKSTHGEFTKAFKMGNYERAEQIAAKEFKLKKTIEENELAIVINELSEYLEECTNELHKDT